MKYPFLCSMAIFLTACGGGSSSDTTTPVQQPTTSGIISIDENFLKGQSTELVLYYPEVNIESVQWQQTAGAAVDLLSSKSKVLAFTIPAIGDYSFKATYLADGVSSEESFNFTAESSTNNKLVARLGHSAVEGVSVSLRAFIDDDIVPESVQWEKISGPNISINAGNQDPQLVIFNAPSVNNDSIVKFEVTAQSNSGDTYSDTVGVLVEDTLNISKNAIFDDTWPLTNVYPYHSNSPYKDVLQACVYSNQLTESCTLGTLPELAQDSNGQTPTIKQVMDRVLVSHDWMGERFEQYLMAYDNHDDFKNLLRATTAIVLSYDIRPSFYYGYTGAIYLDPNDLWLTPEERDTINEAPDYRSDFANELQFIMPWRYVENNEYVSFYYTVNDRYSRPLSDIKYDLAHLLYHELGHANDYFPPAEWNTYPDSYTFERAVVSKRQISTDLDTQYPLVSQEMFDLAAARFKGQTVSTTQKNYTAQDVGEFYKSDDANDFYNYTSEREDLSMLFEELMMALRFDIQRDSAVISDDKYIVSFGQRGRIAEPNIIPRAKYVTSRLLPEVDLQLTDNLLAPINMTPGLDWFENLDISPQPPIGIMSVPLTSERKRLPVTFNQKHRPMRSDPLRVH